MAKLSCAVGIATRNRPDSLARLMGSLLAQTRRPEQIIIVDDGELAETWRAEWATACAAAGVDFVYRTKAPPGRSASRNLAIDLAQADVVCFLDDDCEPAADFLAKLLAALEADDSLVGVTCLVYPPGGPMWADKLYWGMLRAIGWWGLAPTRRLNRPAANLKPVRILPGACAIRKSALQAERFDTASGYYDDHELSVRLARIGRIARVTDVFCYHYHDPIGRFAPFANGVRQARSCLYSHGKLFGPAGRPAAGATLALLAFGEAGFALIDCLRIRFRSCAARLAKSAGLLVGMVTPHGPRGD